MAKRDVPDFDAVVAFDKALAQQKPDLAARLGATAETPREETSADLPSDDEPRLRIVAPQTSSEKRPKRDAHGKTRRGVVSRVSGKELRRFTVYVDLALAQRLRTYCFEHEQNLSEVAAHALELGLQRMLRN